MEPVNGCRKGRSLLESMLLALTILLTLAAPALQAQSNGAQDIPDAPSAGQPPAPKPATPDAAAPDADRVPKPIPFPGDAPQQSQPDQNTDEEKPAPPPLPPV